MNKKIIFIEFIVLIFILFLTFLISNKIYDSYKNVILKNNAYILNESKDKQVIEIIKDININDISLDEIYKYGYKEYELPYLKKKIYIYSYLISISLYLLIITIFNIYNYKRTKKIIDLDEYLLKVLSGNYSLNIRDYKENEISKLKNDIYKVTVKLKEKNINLENDKNYLEELLSNISHQLKTPLTSLYVINDLLLDEKLDNEKQKEFLIKNRNQLEKMEWLITNLLKLSRLDSGVVKLEKENIKFNDFIDKTLEPLMINLELKNIKLIKDGDLDSILNIDINWMGEAILNIVKNAYQYTKDEIKISIKDNALYDEIIISDNGKGISDKDLPHIFERFYKSGKNKDSIGIGLNLSYKIITMHFGTIDVLVDNGTKFIIKLYKQVV